MFLVNETMVEWVNNEIYKKGFDTSLYFVRSFTEYSWGWIVDINHELPILNIEFLSDKLSGTLYVHRNGFILDEYNVWGYCIDEYKDMFDANARFCHIAVTDRQYNWRDYQNEVVSYKDYEEICNY